ncbi:hypothetical protein [Chryseobacterium sp. MFBS3-17]|uniref:hypothetical protein n=1 Tax=Chryseobacterium sp. MFBS3-17 TaxID=2886689 RepID=UPI001D0E21E1|nr:hypothetical protein [Chryseobacterium sp. MFBS3-17]MCC2590213.1 hypothetical protein [Chryseobacterium sp. MFBS3-17]
MKKIIPLALLCFAVSGSAQLRIDTKNPIRSINLKLNKSQAAGIENSGEGAADLNFRKITLPHTSAGAYSISIANPYQETIKFAIGTNALMHIDQVEPNSAWQRTLNDIWVNFVLKTKTKEQSYSLKTGNCYSIFWDRGAPGWNIRKIKCDAYLESDAE